MSIRRNGKHSSSANETLQDICNRSSDDGAMSREDVDDIFWVIRRLNERNRLIADVLSKNPESCLSDEDILDMEDSCEAIRKLYKFVAQSRNRQTSRAGRDVLPQTLRTIAERSDCTLRALRHLNPDLDDLRADDELPAGTAVVLPPNGDDDNEKEDRKEKPSSRQRRTPQRRSASNSSHGGNRRASNRRREVVEVTSEESDEESADTASSVDYVGLPPQKDRGLPPNAPRTLLEVSRASGVKLRNLRGHNPHLDDYSDDEPVPRKLEILVPRTEIVEVSFEKKKKRRGGGGSSDTHGAKSQGTVRPDGSYVVGDNEDMTLRVIAREVAETTLPVIRALNPKLNSVGDDAILPPRTRVIIEVPPSEDDDEEPIARPSFSPANSGRTKTTTTYRQETTRRVHHPPSFTDEPPKEYDDSRRKEGRMRVVGSGGPRPNSYVTRGGETVAELAQRFRCTERQLLACNDDLLQVSHKRSIPAGIEVVPPAPGARR